jgi:plastocyanin
MNAFLVAGGIFAAWAVIVALLGMRGFPANRTGERIAIAIAVVLFVGAVSSAIADQTKVGERKGPEPKEPAAAPAGQARAGGGKPTSLALAADPTGATKFDKAALSATAGKVTITMTNPSPVPHNVSLKGGGANEMGKTVQGNGKSTVTADLKAGSYEFYCSVPGHEQSGMKGTLTVK